MKVVSECCNDYGSCGRSGSQLKVFVSLSVMRLCWTGGREEDRVRRECARGVRRGQKMDRA